MEDQKPDWTIGELYQKAWELIKKYKVLWVFGVAAASGASINFRGLDSLDQNSIQRLITPGVPEASQSGTLSYVLGATTSKPFTEMIGQLFSLVPWWLYLVISLEIVFLMILYAVISYIYKAWSEAALLHAIDDGLKNITPTIESASKKAFSAIKSLIWLTIVPLLGLILVSTILFTIIIVIIAAGSLVFKLIGGLALVIAVGAFVYWLIYLMLSSTWASRIVVLKGLSGMESLKVGYIITKRKFWSMVLLGLVNTIMTVFIVGVPIAVMVGIFVAGFLSFKSLPTVGVLLLIVGGITFLMFILGFTLLSGILTAFKAAVWSAAYKNIEGKYHEK